MNHKVKCLIAAIVVLGTPLKSQALFGGGGVVGSATEITQMLNHAEMITTAKNAIDTAMNTLKQVDQLKQQITSLPTAAINAIVGDAAPQLQAVLGIYKQLDDTQKSYGELQQRLNFEMQSISAMNISPSQYLLTRAKLAKAKGGIYQASIDANQQAMQSAQTQAKKLDKMIASNSEIVSQVGGLQAVANSNVQVLGAINNMSNSLINANMLAASEKKDEQTALASKAQLAASEAAFIAALPAPKLTYPNPATTAVGSPQQ